MTNALKIVEKSQQIIENANSYIATVVSDVDSYHDISVKLHDDTVLNVTKAASCSLCPRLGDLVLIAGDVANGYFILHILSQAQPDIKNVIDFGNDVSIKSKNLAFDTTAQIDIISQQLNVRNESTKLEVANFSLIARNIQQIAHTLSQKFTNIFKVVDGIQSTKAASIRSIVSGRFFCKAKNLTMNADQEVAIDGNKINMG